MNKKEYFAKHFAAREILSELQRLVDDLVGFLELFLCIYIYIYIYIYKSSRTTVLFFLQI